jgi:hypothetical protein
MATSRYEKQLPAHQVQINVKFIEPIKGVPRKKYYQYTAIDDQGRLPGYQGFRATAMGYRDLLTWLQSQGRIVAIGVEGTGNLRCCIDPAPTAGAWRSCRPINVISPDSTGIAPRRSVQLHQRHPVISSRCV